jgi:histidinol dehydrogenase
MSDLLPILDGATEDPIQRVLHRAPSQDSSLIDTVAGIIDDVRRRGDAALIESARKFDAPDLHDLWVSDAEVESAILEPHQVEALELAGTRIGVFHAMQLRALTMMMQSEEIGANPLIEVTRQFSWTIPAAGKDEPGTGRIGQRLVPVRRAGVYVPGGAAAYPSSVLMNAIPARTAGVLDVILASPARRDGSIHPAVLQAGKLVAADGLLKVGGAAAIAALALGTESVQRVDVIVGPGNKWVNEAKRQLWGQVGLDGYAGPSEVAVLVDGSANLAWAAADLITQVEHAPDNAAFLVSLSRHTLEAVLAEVEKQLQTAPRATTIRQALKENSLAVVAKDKEQAYDFLNALAPEHLTLSVENPEAAASRIVTAGCILLGEHTPESAGDFVIGPSHTLPTSGAARFSSPVNVMSFMRFQSISQLSPTDLAQLIRTIETFAEMEDFPAHGAAAKIRRDR